MLKSLSQRGRSIKPTLSQPSQKQMLLVSIIILTTIISTQILNLWSTIIQKPSAETYISQAMQKCLDENSKSTCYKTNAIDFLNRYSLVQILKVFKENETKPQFFTRCHLTAHYLGQEAYKRTKDLKKVFSQSNNSCLGGSFHGAVEGYFIEKGIVPDEQNYGVIGNHVSKICGDKKSYQIPQAFIECNHGLGHALMFITDNELPSTLKLCDSLKTEWERKVCYSGAFMQNADNSSNQDHPSKYYKKEDPAYPCRIIAEKYHHICYSYAVLVSSQTDNQKSIDICNNVPSEFKNACFRTYGRDRTMISADEEDLKKQCTLIKNPASTNECFIGVADNLIVRFGADSPIAYSFCAILPDQNRRDCYDAIRSVLKNVASEDKQLQNCHKIIESQYREKCLDEQI